MTWCEGWKMLWMTKKCWIPLLQFRLKYFLMQREKNAIHCGKVHVIEWCKMKKKNKREKNRREIIFSPWIWYFCDFCMKHFGGKKNLTYAIYSFYNIFFLSHITYTIICLGIVWRRTKCMEKRQTTIVPHLQLDENVLIWQLKWIHMAGLWNKNAN